MSKVHRMNRQRVIDGYGLTSAEVARLSTMDPKDPLSAYAGNMLVHAALIVEDRTVIPENIILGEE